MSGQGVQPPLPQGGEGPPDITPPRERRKDGTLKASTVHQEELQGGRGWPVSSTPSGGSGSSGRSSRGCTPPPASWSQSSRSCSPSNTGSKRGKAKISNSSKKNSSSDNTAESFVTLQTQNSESPSESQITSAKGLQKLQKLQTTTPQGHPSTSSITSSTGTTEVKRSKRKSWMHNAINPTYRSRCNDLRRNFPGLPAEETLIVDYSCALQKDILVHGRLYITTHFLCFYANIFRWETAVTIRWREVTAMTKEKTALVIPNAIQICTGTDKFFFTSFAARDKTHVMLFRLWQNALLDSPASQTEIWSWVQSVYGDQTSRYSDDPEVSNDGGSNYSFDGLEFSVGSPRPRLYSNIAEDDEEKAAPVPVTRSSGEDLVLVSDQSDISDSVIVDNPRSKNRPLTSPKIVSPDILTYEVWRHNKDAREIISLNLAIDIDDLFTLWFTNSKFFYDFQAERQTFDIVQCPWQHSDKSEDKFREVSYTLNLNHAIGPKTTRATEVQTMRSNSVPGHIYNVDVETTNADVPYADCFYVLTHYCIVKVGEGESLLTVLCDIKYKKPPWGLVKTFIEKNCWAGIQEHYTALAASLEREVEGKLEEAKVEGGQKKKTRRQRNQQRRASASEQSSVVSGAPQVPHVRGVNPVKQQQKQSTMTGEPTVFPVLMILLGVLCLVNFTLVIKIWGLEDKLVTRQSSNMWDSPPIRGGGGDWVDVLRKQEIQHNQDMANWKASVEAASLLLRQTEQNIVRITQESFNRDLNHQLLKHILKLEEETFRKVKADKVPNSDSRIHTDGKYNTRTVQEEISDKIEREESQEL